MVDEDPGVEQHSEPDPDNPFPPGYMGVVKNLFNSVCQTITRKDCPAKLWVSEGAQWAVSRERIQAVPKELYMKALTTSEGYQQKTRGLVLEALWPVVWNAEGWNPLNTSRPLQTKPEVDASPMIEVPEEMQKSFIERALVEDEGNGLGDFFGADLSRCIQHCKETP